MADATDKTDVNPDSSDELKAEPTPKTYSEEEFKKAVDARDKAKAELRKREEADAKAAEAKEIEEGKLKEVLERTKAENAELLKFKQAAEEQDKQTRDSALAKLSDEDKEIAMELSTPKLLAFVEKQSTRQLDQGNGRKVDTSKDHLKPKPGESANDYNQRVMRELSKQH